jgi:N,N'-diacetyllegionaminate synthase
MSIDSRNTKHVLIIAECGHNWNGNMETAKKMIEVAKECGADVVKFQLYNTDDLNTGHYDELKKSELNQKQIEELIKECQNQKIEFMASAFDNERLGWILPYSKRLKIASRSIYNRELINEMAKTAKQIIVSLGKFKEIQFPYIRANNVGVDFLYCVSQYPTKWEDVNLLRIRFQPGAYTGISDHTTGIEVPLVAVSRGAKIVEKHFTLSRRLPGCDQVCSLEPKELKKMVEEIRKIEYILYRG